MARFAPMTALLVTLPIQQAAAATASNDFADLPLLLCAALASALIVALAALWRLTQARGDERRALHELSTLLGSVKAREATRWRDSGVSEIDAIAHSILELQERLREKRQKLTELTDLLAKKSCLANQSDMNSRLHAILDAVPVGILIAEAPSGRIIEGNRVIETILRHPIRYSANTAAYDEWKAFHQDGRPVLSQEYPLARALAGEDNPTLECKYVRGEGGLGWINIVGAPIHNDEGAIIGAIVAVTDIDDIKTAEAHRRAMSRELHHRVNNALAMIQGIANITARTARDFASFRADFTERVQCLSRISTLLVRNSWELTPLRDLIETGLFCEKDQGARIEVSGEDVELRSDVALALGVALFELLSNAQRHGALSGEEGRVAVKWRIERENERPRLMLDWRESGGPAVERPERAGVGHFLLTSVLARQIGGDIELSFEPEGLHATIYAEI
ncbi:HWE histidine kinase domain-containing protein [Methylocystis sp. 9N]|uniref:histidine kinase n=1 Tax=Methylocystis borbori TaxID=3118750 RepID=A0ABU7XH62_9HYPH